MRFQTSLEFSFVGAVWTMKLCSLATLECLMCVETFFISVRLPTMTYELFIWKIIKRKMYKSTLQYFIEQVQSK